MKRHTPRSAWLELAASAVCGVLALLTFVWRDWIQPVFHFDPDHHNGALEWVAVCIWLAMAIALGASARHRRTRARDQLHATTIPTLRRAPSRRS
jgi:hypothetical protein